MLCTSMGYEKIASIYVVSYYMVDFKIRPIKVHLESFIYQTKLQDDKFY